MKTSFRIPHDILFQIRLFLFFCGVSRQTVILFSYGFFMFYSMVVKYKNSWAAIINMLATSKSCGNICLFLSTLPTRQDNFTSFSPYGWVFSCCVFWVMDGVICTIFLALITVLAETVIVKNVMHMW